MDQKGSDGMCFWSENHSLIFYSCAMIAGEMYPNEYFTTSRKTGKEMIEDGRDKVVQWITDIETDGYEEFLSARIYVCYLCSTFKCCRFLQMKNYHKEQTNYWIVYYRSYLCIHLKVLLLHHKEEYIVMLFIHLHKGCRH